MHPALPALGRSRSLLAAFSLAFVSAHTQALAADPAVVARNWPEWRGPHANGLVTHGNPPLHWSETKNVKWKVSLPGRSHATPIVWENKIFLINSVPTGKKIGAFPATPPSTVLGQAQPRPDRPGGPGGPGGGRRGPGGPGGDRPNEEYSFTTLCLDRATGKILWEKEAVREVPYQGIQQMNTFSSGSPITDGTLLFSSFGSYGLFCYDLEGNQLWNKTFPKANVTFGEGSSPALHGNTLVVVRDNNEESWIYAFDKASGRELWKKRRDEGSGWTTPYIIQHSGKTQVLVPGANAIRSYDLTNGEVLWQCGGLGSNPVAMIVTDQDTAYAMSGHRSPQALAIQLGRSGDLTGTDAVRWKLDRGTPYVPSPLLYDDILFFCQRNDAIISCVDPRSGTPHYSQVRLDGLTGIYASPIGAQNRIYLVGQDGGAVVLERSKELKVLATNKLDDGFDASPAVAGNELFLRGRAHLYCIAE